MLNGIDLPLIGAALLFGAVGVIALLFFRKYEQRKQEQGAVALEAVESKLTKQRGLSMERRLAQAEEARRKAQWSRVRNQGRDARIEAICAKLPDQAKELRRLLSASRVLDGNAVRTALRTLNTGQGMGGSVVPPIITVATSSKTKKLPPVTTAPVSSVKPVTTTVAPEVSPLESAAAMPTAQRADVLAALKVIAGKDDGAVSEDGRGFNREHTKIGQRLASAQELSPVEAAVGQQLVRFYKKQLAGNHAELLSRAIAGIPRGRVDLSEASLEQALAQPAANSASLPQSASGIHREHTR